MNMFRIVLSYSDQIISIKTCNLLIILSHKKRSYHKEDIFFVSRNLNFLIVPYTPRCVCITLVLIMFERTLSKHD